VLAVGVTVPTVFIWRGCTVDAEVYLSGHQTGDDYDCAMELRLRDIPPELEEWIISEARRPCAALLQPMSRFLVLCAGGVPLRRRAKSTLTSSRTFTSSENFARARSTSSGCATTKATRAIPATA
jgi:hypothetical protein